MLHRSVDLTIRSLVGDALVLVDEAVVANIDDEMFQALNIALDPDGVTDVRDEFPDEPWSGVWNREGEPVWTLCREGRMLLVLLEQGDYFTRAFEEDLRDVGLDIARGPSLGRLVLDGPTMGLISGMDWMRRRTLGPKAASYRSIPVAEGERVIQIGFSPPPRDGSQVAGRFWGEGRPSLLIGVAREAAQVGSSNVFRVRNDDLTLPAP